MKEKEKTRPVAKTEVIVGDLQKFFDTDQTRTLVGRLREMFDTIEKLRDGGMSLENIRLVLKKNSLEVSLSTLTKSLQRIRAERDIENGEIKPKKVKKAKPARPMDERKPPLTVEGELQKTTKSKEESVNETTLPGFGNNAPRKPTI